MEKQILWCNNDVEKYIISYHRTANGHCWIDGVTGGYVETCDNGRYYTDMGKAVLHRVKHIKKL